MGLGRPAIQFDPVLISMEEHLKGTLEFSFGRPAKTESSSWLLPVKGQGWDEAGGIRPGLK